jgi:LuxR family maltose regulon positive regulatory protein
MYLAEEVLEQRPEGTLNFLLQTSILDRLCGSLCDAVTEQHDGQATLEKLEQANMFMIPLDDERKWYRYHHLFAEVLRARLQQTQPGLMVERHCRASIWYEQNGWAAEAVTHALAAQDFEQASRLIEQKSRAMWQRGEVTTLQNWLASVPSGIRRARPQLCLAQAWSALAVGQFALVDSSIQEADDAMSLLTEVELKPLRAQADAIRSTLAGYRQDTARAIELAHQALEHLPEEDHYLRGILAYNLGRAYLSLGDLLAASQKLKEAATLSFDAGDLSTAGLALATLGAELEAQGRLREAASCYRQVIQAAQKNGRPLPVIAAGGAYARLGGILYKWNQLDESTQCANQGIELSRAFQYSGAVFIGCLVLVSVLRVRNDLTGAIDALQNAETALRSSSIPKATLRMVEAVRAQLWLAQGNIAGAAQWATIYERDLNFPASGDWSDMRQLGPMFDYECLTLVRVRMAEARWDEALRMLTQLQPVVEAGARKPGLIELLALRALVFQMQTSSAEANAVLERALTLAEPEGYIRVFVDEGEPMERAIRNFRGEIGKLKDPTVLQEHLMAYADKLLKAFTDTTPQLEIEPANLPILQSSPIDPLSARELEVLHLIAEGLSNQAIAQKLYLSTGTVKVHLKHIYGKLDVNSRTQAVARLRELNL